MTPIKLKSAVLLASGFVDGTAHIIRGHEKDFVVFRAGKDMIISLDDTQMNRLIKAWGEVRGGYPI